MCYYARTDYACGDWKWGNMRERCPRQHRIGETCGAKLVHTESITDKDEPCKTCQELQVKQRRLAKIRENIDRWSSEGDRFLASLDKAEREAQELKEKIRELHAKRPSVEKKSNGQRHGLGNSAADRGPSLPSFANDASLGSYTWTSSPQAYSSSGLNLGGYPTVNNGTRPQAGYTNVPPVPTSIHRKPASYVEQQPRRR